ncbi:MAG: Superoxide dismutase [Cu-Zn] [Chrysothrix sp. TS-e1954]|nr:MAG: Superoxide dismutase [Cu-Zn] [Chrysothrix sp. TS-e1954]
MTYDPAVLVKDAAAGKLFLRISSPATRPIFLPVHTAKSVIQDKLEEKQVIVKMVKAVCNNDEAQRPISPSSRLVKAIQVLTLILYHIILVAVLRGDSRIGGNVTFEQASESAPTTISWNISGHDANAERGMHVHAYGDNTNGCTSAGPHFNPFTKKHGAPTDSERHVGDLGNFKTDGQGNANSSVTDSHIKLIGSESVIGRTIVVHAGTDDLGKGGNEESTKTGNAGPRPACGVIGIAA